ncbi:MAG TPA: M20/M25/M40 family metallo-hydrolase, partial [Longimicrobiaceae bacterium]|nr:M20/M25/M40 family metallo-hydrolase [Longimicrobiaceae bacterium]
MTPIDAALDRIRPATIDAHLRFLSHPLLEGRAPGTRGGDLAAEYVRAQFRRIGLEPVDGSHFQPVPLVGLTPEPRLSLEFPDGGGLEPAYREDFVMRSGLPQPEVEAEGELVYVGYGISAPEYGWDDYKDVDVRGRVLLMRVNDPGTEATPGFFGGRALTYYGRWTYKYEEASRRGAAGVLLVHTDESAGYGWNVVRTSNTGEQFDLAGTPEFPLGVKGWISSDAAAEALRRAGLDPDELLRRSEERGFRPVATGIRARVRVRSRVREVRTANVAGLLPGADPALADEVVLLTSHYDHLGTGEGEDGGRVVYHGAYDNASGVALLLAVAEAAVALPEPPRRPLLFLSTTAEESGLLGAEWYARHPLFPLSRTAAELNLDGANLEGRTRDLAPLGADRSELGETVREAARAEGMTLRPDPHPEQGMFFRQDHFPLARAGVPALALDHGLDYEAKPEGWGEGWYEEFVTRHYHQPSDAYREGLDFGGAVQQGRVLLRTALAVASAGGLPRWNPGSEFARRGE